MLKKFFFFSVLSVLCFSSSNAGNRFFIEGGFNGRMIGGEVEYMRFSSTHYYESVTDSNLLGWNNKILTNFNGTLGFRLNDKFVTNISVQYFLQKAGYGNLYTIYFNYYFVSSGENISRSTQDEKPITNLSDIINFRITQNYYINKSLFVLGGFEYLTLQLDLGKYDIYKDNAFGYLAGIGYELPISSKISMLATSNYSFTSYNGDKFLYEILEFNIGGLELGYTLRYYLK